MYVVTLFYNTFAITLLVMYTIIIFVLPIPFLALISVHRARKIFEFHLGHVTLKFCLPGALPCLPKFSISLIIHELKNGSRT